MFSTYLISNMDQGSLITRNILVLGLTKNLIYLWISNLRIEISKAYYSTLIDITEGIKVSWCCAPFISLAGVMHSSASLMRDKIPSNPIQLVHVILSTFTYAP